MYAYIYIYIHIHTCYTRPRLVRSQSGDAGPRRQDDSAHATVTIVYYTDIIVYYTILYTI